MLIILILLDLMRLIIVARAAAEGQFEPAHRGDDQTPSRGKLDRAGLGVRLRLDDRFVAHVPLHQ